MKPVEGEFLRPLRADRVPAGGCVESISADAKEREAIARRLDLPSVKSLSGNLRIEPSRGKGLRVHGDLEAELTRTCVVSLEDFDSVVRVPIERYYLPAGTLAGGQEEADEEDVDLIENGEIDLGELLTESLALALDPYPRKPGASFSPVSVEGEPSSPDRLNPFAELARLKERASRK